MKTVINSVVQQIKKNDAITNGGLIFLFGFILPTLISVMIDVFTNGSNML